MQISFTEITLLFIIAAAGIVGFCCTLGVLFGTSDNGRPLTAGDIRFQAWILVACLCVIWICKAGLR